MAADVAGHPIILVSNLAAHTPALMADPRCAMLLGEPGDGDPLAHPRISLTGTAEVVAGDGEEGAALRARFLARHPQAAGYAALPDFHLVRITVESASLNGGFAKAYRMTAEDVVDPPTDPSLQKAILRALTHMNADHLDAVDTLAHRDGAETRGWRILSGDARGFDIGRGDAVRRIEFITPVVSGDDLRRAYVDLLKAG